jgi:hypothetical protein
MDKASKALRRSGVRIKSIGSGHSDLQMVISQLKDVRQDQSNICLYVFSQEILQMSQTKYSNISFGGFCMTVLKVADTFVVPS